MYDDATANDGVGPVESDMRINRLESCVARRIRRDVAEVTRVTLRCVRPAMFRAGRIEMASGRRCIRRGAIALLVYVEAVFARGQATDLRDHRDALGCFVKVNRAM